MTQIGQLRDHIRQLDEDILRLIAERMKAATRIGERKKAAGIPLRDWNMERQVLDRAARQAAELGLAAPMARSIMQMLIAAARLEQERTSFSTYRGSAESILLIGGRGKMGRWFADFFGNQGHRVTVHDPRGNGNGPPGAADLEAALEGTSFALIAAPLDGVSSVLDDLAARGYGGTVFDIASLKGHLKPAIARARAANVAVTSIHPMFGPAARTLSDQVICICDCGDAAATRRVEAFFADTAATLVRLSLEEHDEIVSYVLGLSHLTNLVFAKVLMESGRSYDELSRVASTTFQSQMVTTATVIRENPDLYYAIQHLNPFSSELCGTFQRAFEAISGWVRSGNRSAFTEMMQTGEKWMVGDDAG